MGTAAAVRGGADTQPGWAQAGTFRGTGRWGRKRRCWAAAQEAGARRGASGRLWKSWRSQVPGQEMR